MGCTQYFQPISDIADAKGVSHKVVLLLTPSAWRCTQVTTLDRSNLELSVLGYSVLPVFCMASDGSQPKDKSDLRVCINAGGFQLPVWPTYPPSSGPLRAAALQSRPRLPCASVLLRIMTPAEAKPLRCAPRTLLLLCSSPLYSRVTPSNSRPQDISVCLIAPNVLGLWTR